MKPIHWHDQTLDLAVRQLRSNVPIGEFAGLVRTDPPQIDTVVFRIGDTLYVGFGGGLPALNAGDTITWDGQSGEVVLFANAPDTITELTERAAHHGGTAFGRGLAQVAHALHIDRALDRLGAPQWFVVIRDWGPYDRVTEPLPGAEQDWTPPSDVH